MADTSIAEIIARTICEFDRRSWSEIGPTERHRYFHTARMAQDRIRNALLNGASGQRMASDLIGGSGSGDAARLAAALHGAASDRRLH